MGVSEEDYLTEEASWPLLMNFGGGLTVTVSVVDPVPPLNLSVAGIIVVVSPSESGCKIGERTFPGDKVTGMPLLYPHHNPIFAVLITRNTVSIALHQGGGQGLLDKTAWDAYRIAFCAPVQR